MDFQQILEECGAYYQTVFDSRGKPLTPLVQYTATYKGRFGRLANKVGMEFVNFSRVEEKPRALRAFAVEAVNQIADLVESGMVLMAAPYGGIALANVMAQILLDQGIEVDARYLEKTAVYADGRIGGDAREMIQRRHRIMQGERVVIVDDVSNAGWSVGKAAIPITTNGGIVVGVVCGVKRNTMTTITIGSREVPVRCAHEKYAPYYEQEDPAVADFLLGDLLEHNPKDHWDRLMMLSAKYRL